MSEATGDRNIRDESIEDDWQASESTWKDRMAHLCLNYVMSDITFKVKNKKIKAHKLVLASASPVFHAMFYGPVAETRTEIEIIDCPDAELFEEFLSFVYSEDLFMTWDNLFPIAYLAKKYYIPSLTKECCKFLSRSLRVENVLEVLSQCVLMDEKEMAEQCLELIRVGIRQLVRTEEFLKLDLQLLKSILALNVLDIEEVDLVLALDKWCIHHLERQGKEVTPEEKREIMGSVVNLIRFPSLSVKDLTNSCLPSGLITKDQFVELVSLQMSEDTEKDRKIDTKKIPFVISSRKRSTVSICTDSDEDSCSSYGSCLQMGKALWLKGVKIIGDVTNEGDSSRVCIVKRQDGLFITPKFSIKVADDKHGKRVSYLIFIRAIKILPWVEYNILCVREIDMPNKEKELSILGIYTTPIMPAWNEVPEYHLQLYTTKFIHPTLCSCWIEVWNSFPEIIVSSDNHPIPVEEDVISQENLADSWDSLTFLL